MLVCKPGKKQKYEILYGIWDVVALGEFPTVADQVSALLQFFNISFIMVG